MHYDGNQEKMAFSETRAVDTMQCGSEGARKERLKTSGRFSMNGFGTGWESSG